MNNKKVYNYNRNREEALQVALKYVHRVDFIKGPDNAYYQWARKQGLDFYESIVSHMIPKGTWYKKLLYTYEFENNVIYIGITNNRTQRLWAHKYSDSIVADYRNENNEEPIYTELTDYIELKIVLQMEKDLIKKYRDMGWTVLNKTNGGESGGNNEWITKEVCAKEALKYNYRWEFGQGSPSHYSKAGKRGWMDEICSHMDYKLESWDKQKIRETSMNSECETITQFWKEHRGAAGAAKELGIYEEIKEYFEWRGGHSWTKEEIHEIAKTYTSRKKFILENKNAAAYASYKGWYDEITSHMGYAKHGKKWTKEEVHQDALKYNTRTEWARACDTKGTNPAYQSARHNGWLDEVTTHMVEGEKNTIKPGEDCPWSKLTEEIVIWLRENRGKYVISKKAKELRVSRGTIFNILSRKTWTHI